MKRRAQWIELGADRVGIATVHPSYPLRVPDEERKRPTANSSPTCGKSDAASTRCVPRYSTVTLFARLRGWSTSVPLSTAT